MSERISKEVGSLTDTVSGRLEEMDRLISVQGKSLADTSRNAARETSSTIEAQLNALEEHATRRSNEITANFDTLVVRIDRRSAHGRPRCTKRSSSAPARWLV